MGPGAVEADRLRRNNDPHKPTPKNPARYSLFAIHTIGEFLLWAAREDGGKLSGKSLVVETDRAMCESCKKVLPLVVRELGSPTVTFIDKNGTVYRASHGELTLRKIKE